MDPLQQYLSQFRRPVPVHAIDRRAFLRGGSAGVAAVAFGAFGAAAFADNRKGGVGRGDGSDRFPHDWRKRWSRDYGELYPAVDEATGLALLALPRGFRYKSFGWRGQKLIEGNRTPGGHDGMAVVARQDHRIVMPSAAHRAHPQRRSIPVRRESNRSRRVRSRRARKHLPGRRFRREPDHRTQLYRQRVGGSDVL